MSTGKCYYTLQTNRRGRGASPIFLSTTIIRKDKVTYISKQFVEEVILPDGSVASSVADVDKYLRTSGLARSSDYQKPIGEAEVLSRFFYINSNLMENRNE